MHRILSALLFVTSISLSGGFCLAAEGKSASQSASIRLTPGITIMVGEQEPAPVRRAVEDLRRDLKKVLGCESPVVHSIVSSGDAPALIVAGPNADRSAIPLDDRVAGWEGHGLYVREIDGRPHVVLHGSDMRGAIYAIYAFSEQFLGVKPLWYWANQEPPAQSAIEVPADLADFIDPPQVQWRAWFLNDDHRLQAWFRQAPEHVDAVGEAMLRLKANTIELYQIGPRGGPTTRYAITPEAAMAARFGLVVSTTHISPFGSVYGNGLSDWKKYWRNIRDQEPPALSMNNTEAMTDFWRYHIETVLHHHLEAVWTIAFRGHTDAPFWKSIQDVPESQETRMAITERMWDEQIALLRKTTGQPDPPMRIIFYHELSEALAKGDLQLPHEPSLIWNFVAARRDHFPAHDVRTLPIPAGQKVGYYMNLQFTSTGSHYAQAEGPWKMERNFRMIDRLSPTGLTFAVVNAGNIREHLMELAAYSAMMWDFKPYDSDRFLHNFCAVYFGPEHAGQAADLYRRFYNAYWQQRRPDLEGLERQYIFHDYRLARAIMTLTKRLESSPDTNKDMNPFRSGDWFRIKPADNDADSQLEAILNGMNASVTKLRSVTKEADALLPDLPEPRRAFFNDSLRVQARYLMHESDTVRHLAEALLARTQGDDDSRLKHLKQAEQAARAMVDALEDTRHDPFANWYDRDSAMGPRHRRDEVIRLRPEDRAD